MLSIHEETTNHEPLIWEEEWNTKAILCGVCMEELTINEYFSSNNLKTASSHIFLNIFHSVVFAYHPN